MHPLSLLPPVSRARCSICPDAISQLHARVCDACQTVAHAGCRPHLARTPPTRCLGEAPPRGSAGASRPWRPALLVASAVLCWVGFGLREEPGSLAASAWFVVLHVLVVPALVAEVGAGAGCLVAAAQPFVLGGVA